MTTSPAPSPALARLVIDPPRIRFAMCRFADWRHLDVLIRDCFPQFSVSEVDYFIRAYARFSCLAWLDDRAIGYWMHSGGKGPATGWVEQVGVAHTYRSIGVGRRLIIDYLQFASWVGFQQVGASVLKTNTASLATFRSLGFDTRRDTTDDRLQMFHAIGSRQFGDWPAAVTVAGVELNPIAARDQFRRPLVRSLPYRVVGRIATTLLSLVR